MVDLGLSRREFGSMTFGEFMEKEAHFEQNRAFELHKTRLIMAKHHHPENDAKTFTLREVLYIPLYDGDKPQPMTAEEMQQELEQMPDNKTAWKRLTSGEVI